MPCTYQRLDHANDRGTPLRKVDSPTDFRLANSARVDAGTSVSEEDTRYPFFLAFTAPSPHESTRTIVADGTGKAVEQEEVFHRRFGVSSEGDLSYYDWFFWDKEDWVLDLPEFDKPHLDDPTVFSSPHPWVTFKEPSVLEIRMRLVISQLAAAHSTLLVRKPGSSVTFDSRLAEDVFTAANLVIYVSAYFQRLHEFYPILHRPTFDTATAALPLLLSVFLFGSICSAPLDDALSARDFLDIAEEYIFSLLRIEHLGQPNYKVPRTVEQVETLQAALIIEIIQNGTNDTDTRRRLRLERHPWLIASMRSSGLFEVTHHSSGHNPSTVQIKWRTFVFEELCIRYDPSFHLTG